MVAVPEVGEIPPVRSDLADAGYFEGLTVTQEDRERRGSTRATACGRP